MDAMEHAPAPNLFDPAAGPWEHRLAHIAATMRQISTHTDPEAMVAAYDAAMAAGDGAVAFEGKMIDVPIVARAQRVLAIRDRIEARRG